MTSGAEPGEVLVHTVIDLRWMHPGVAGGIENLSRSFLDHLLALDSFNRYTVLVPAEVRYDFDGRGRSNFEFVAADGLAAYARRAALCAGRQYWRTPALESLRRIRRLDADVAFSIPGYIAPDLAPLGNVLVMPDIQHEYHPEFFSPDALEERRRLYTLSVRQATHICAMSEFTRQTLIERLAIAPGRITTIHLAADPMFCPGSPARLDPFRVLERHGLVPGGYLLFPANTWPHKNHRTAFEALRLLREAHGLDLPLVCAGAPKEAHVDLLRQIEDARLADRVRFLGYCHPTYMPALYQGAAALFFPSLFEGFGLPLLEAMWCDCPVVCSNVTSLPEVAGDAALLVDPRSPDELAYALSRVLTDTALRRTLVERGRERVKQFSWTKFTREVVSCLRGARQRRDGDDIRHLSPLSSPHRLRDTQQSSPAPTPAVSWTPQGCETPRPPDEHLDRVGRTHRHLRVAKESLDRGQVRLALLQILRAAILAPRLTFYAGAYPWVRNEVCAKVVKRLEERRARLSEGIAHRDRIEAWPDGWAGPRLVLTLDTPCHARAVIFGGWASLKRLRWLLVLTVRLDDKVIGRCHIARSGRFIRRVALTHSLPPGRHTVEVEANGWFVPHHVLRNGDFRPLSWRFEGAELEPVSALGLAEQAR